MMKLSLFKTFNSIVLLIIAGVVGFLSFAFYLGSQDDHQQLLMDLPLSFIFRLLFFSAVGMIGVGILLIINFVFNKTVLEGATAISLTRLARNGVFWVLLAVLIGNIIFFRLD